jgi:hypothetical protein
MVAVFIGLWLQSAAAVQPAAASGIYQHPYPFKGQIRFVTDQQVGLANVSHILGCGWLIVFAAGGWIMIVETKAAKGRLEMFLRNREEEIHGFRK